MNDYRKSVLKRLLSESLRERQDSYVIQELFEQFPTIPELMDVSEQQLMSIKGIGVGKTRQIIALLKLAKALTIPTHDQVSIRTPKDVFDFLEPELRYQTKEHFTCLFLNTKNRIICKETVSIGSLMPPSSIQEKFSALQSSVAALLSYAPTIIPVEVRLHLLKT